MSHEAAVERFYSWGVERYGTFHDNYLNFGLWEPEVTGFVQAAEALLERVATMMELQPGAELLDVACGMGTQDRFLVGRFGGISIDAVDLTHKHIETARRRHAHPSIRFATANACALPFPAGRFSHVMAIEGIVHFDTRERFFAEAHRVLRPGGRLGVADFFAARKPATLLERWLFAACCNAWHVPVVNRVGLDGYRAALDRAGFGRVALEVVSEAVIPGYVAEQRRPSVRSAQRRIRGQVVGRLGVVIDRLVDRAYRRGLLGYLVGVAQRT
jgi:SAM-dependent methyltransferase